MRSICSVFVYLPNLFLSIWSFLLIASLIQISKTSAQRSIVDECRHCQYMVRTFLEGLNKTEKLHFGGGNTDWEERKLGKFKTRVSL
ncbi:cysteine-rich with EGF-like domain protein 2 [Ditylenchus destructor]|nr:cysteine-rich with EGF-like domain protein 2 [Ditylenchus destructor]